MHLNTCTSFLLLLTYRIPELFRYNKHVLRQVKMVPTPEFLWSCAYTQSDPHALWRLNIGHYESIYEGTRARVCVCVCVCVCEREWAFFFAVSIWCVCVTLSAKLRSCVILEIACKRCKFFDLVISQKTCSLLAELVAWSTADKFSVNPCYKVFSDVFSEMSQFAHGFMVVSSDTHNCWKNNSC